jgi:DNA-binding transcriptional MocR family regulator
MNMDTNHLISHRTLNLGSNIIREILKVVSQPGMFLWAEGPKGMDMEQVFWNTVKRKVAFVPGKYFYTEKDAGQETMRLNFTMADEDAIDRSIKTISEVIKEEEKDSSNRMTG